MTRRTKVRSLAALAIGLALAALFWPRQNTAAREELDRLRGAIEVETEPAELEPQQADPREQAIEVRLCVAKLCLNDATAGLFSVPGQDAEIVHGRVQSLDDAHGSIERLAVMGVLEIISLPQIVSQSRQVSYVMTGCQIAAVASNPPPAPAAVAFQNVGCATSVLPTVLKDGTLHVEVEAELSWLAATPATAANPTPPNISKASTGKISARLRSGETLAVAGLTVNGRGVKTLKAPLLSQIPGIGDWFSWTYERDVDEELIVLVTPRLLPKQP